jgi:hypothetical protein
MRITFIALTLTFGQAFACVAIAQAALAAKQVKANGNHLDDTTVHNLVVPSIENFFKAVEKADQGQKYVLQDLLRLFDLLSTYGEAEAVSQASACQCSDFARF